MMQVERAKQLLFLPGVCEVKINRLIDKIAAMKSSITSARAVRYDGDRIQTSGSMCFTDLVDKCIQLEEKAKILASMKAAAVQIVCDVLSCFPESCYDVRELMYCRYILYWTPEQVCRWLRLTPEEFSSMRKEGLAMFVELA